MVGTPILSGTPMAFSTESGSPPSVILGKIASVMTPEWGGPVDKIHYPIRFYDVLGALLVMAEAGLARDRRCRDALDLLEGKRLDDGSFPAEWTNVRKADRIESRGTYADWGPLRRRKGNPLVTVDALYALKEAGRAT